MLRLQRNNFIAEKIKEITENLLRIESYFNSLLEHLTFKFEKRELINN